MKEEPYGYETLIDLKDCNTGLFTRKIIKQFFIELCDCTIMTPEKLVWWDDIGLPKEFQQKDKRTKGTSAVQFILTSHIFIHTFDLTGRVNINFFSCKDYDVKRVIHYCKWFFEGKKKQSRVIPRW